jgi:glyoxylase-like metal-dependent hydrolase (beta-lactamase superfamily II)
LKNILIKTESIRTINFIKPGYIHSILITICSILIFQETLSQEIDSSLTISNITGNFYIFTTSKTFDENPPVSIPANGMYVVTESGVVLIDSPFDTTKFQPLLDSIFLRHKKKVIMCIATHSHNDRTAGLEYYRNMGIQTYTTKMTDEISVQQRAHRAAFLINNDTIFTVGQYTFQTYYPGHGHSPDNIVIWFEKQKLLYGGCFVKSIEIDDLGNLADANIKAWETSMIKLQKRFNSPKIVIPGHFGGTGKESLTHTLKLIRSYY